MLILLISYSFIAIPIAAATAATILKTPAKDASAPAAVPAPASTPVKEVANLPKIVFEAPEANLPVPKPFERSFSPKLAQNPL